MNWNGWSLDRVLILMMGLFFLVIFVQVSLFHYRQNFRHWSMWMPVLSAPVLGIGMVLCAFYNVPWLRGTLAVLLAAGLIEGAIGSYMHIHGVGKRVGGYELRNFMVGPPPALPAMVSAVSLLGLFALYWK